MTNRSRSGPLARRALLAAGCALALAQPLAAAPTPLGYDPAATALAVEIGRGSGPQAEGIAAFYRARGFAPLWTAGDEASMERLRALAVALGRAGDHGLPVARFDPAKLRAILAAARTADARAAAEIEVSQLYLDLADALSAGILDPRQIDAAMKRTVRHRDAAELLAAVAGDRPARAIRDLAPTSTEYVRLMARKRQLEAVVRRGGWGVPIRSGTLRPGDTGQDVVALRERLVAMGYLGRHLSARYDDAITAAVTLYQEDAGLEVDGVAGPDTIRALNVSAEERLGAVLVAMERERWINDPRDKGRVIVVNLPEFKARVFDDGRQVFETRAVVGAVEDGKPTPEFSDEMTHMVINPSWYVPPGIIKRDYLPKLQANPYALSQYEIVDRRGQPANRAAGFRQYTASNFPFSIRQKPGDDNALGQVKFMFPNPWSIYLHDTPAKSLFDRDSRAYSSGCVRLAEPFEFAYLLLSRQEADPVRAFNAILDTGRERRVNLEVEIPVHLIYRTAFTDTKGRLHYRADIYGRDAKVLAALEARGVSPRPVSLVDAGALAPDADAG